MLPSIHHHHHHRHHRHHRHPHLLSKHVKTHVDVRNVFFGHNHVCSACMSVYMTVHYVYIYIYITIL